MLTKLWNAFRFCKDHIEGYEKPEGRPELGAVNEWLLHRLHSTVSSYRKHFDEYEHSFALEAAERFFWHTFCDNYLELIKDQIFNPDKYSPEVIEGTRYALHETCFALLQLFAPFIPHLTEKLYQLFFEASENSSSLHTTQLDTKRFAYNFESSVQVIDHLVEIVGLVRKLKSEKKLSLKVELAKLTIHGGDKTILELLKTQETVLAGVTQAKEIAYSSEAADESALQEKDGAWFCQVKLQWPARPSLDTLSFAKASESTRDERRRK